MTVAVWPGGSDVVRECDAGVCGVCGIRLGKIGSAIEYANSAASGATSAVEAAGADAVSTSISQLFGAHAAAYQAISSQAALFHQQFVQLMSGGATEYASTEAANAAPLDIGPQAVLGAANASGPALGAQQPVIGAAAQASSVAAGVPVGAAVQPGAAGAGGHVSDGGCAGNGPDHSDGRDHRGGGRTGGIGGPGGPGGAARANTGVCTGGGDRGSGSGGHGSDTGRVRPADRLGCPGGRGIRGTLVGRHAAGGDADTVGRAGRRRPRRRLPKADRRHLRADRPG